MWADGHMLEAAPWSDAQYQSSALPDCSDAQIAAHPGSQAGWSKALAPTSLRIVIGLEKQGIQTTVTLDNPRVMAPVSVSTQRYWPLFKK